MKTNPKIHGRNGARVDVALHDLVTTRDVFWSSRTNSYVLVKPIGRYDFTLADGTPVLLMSVNGIGEIRWDVQAYSIQSGLRLEAQGKLDPTWDCVEQLAAARHFGLYLDGTEI